MSRRPHLNYVNSKNEPNEMGQILTGSAWINCMNKTDPSAEEKINQVFDLMVKNRVYLSVQVRSKKDRDGRPSDKYQDWQMQASVAVFPNTKRDEEPTQQKPQAQPQQAPIGMDDDPLPF